LFSIHIFKGICKNGQAESDIERERERERERDGWIGGRMDGWIYRGRQAGGLADGRTGR
jgi:hypothetical protein